MFFFPTVTAIQYLANTISSPVDSDQGCTDWLYEFAKLNQDFCLPVHAPPPEGTVVSMAFHHERTYEGTRKVKDGSYRCQVRTIWKGCPPDLLFSMTRMTFHMLCLPIDDIETRISYRYNGYWSYKPERLVMYCRKQENHQELVAARQVAVNEAREVLMARLGQDIVSCIDEKL